MLTSTDNPPLKFTTTEGVQKARIPGHKIGWLHSLSDQPGASYDICIKDALGRKKFEQLGCKSDTKEFGQLVNLPTLVGEDVEVEVANLKGASEISIFLN